MHIFAFCFWCIGGKQASWLHEEVKKRKSSMKLCHSFTIKINSETSELTHVNFPSKAAVVHTLSMCQKSQTLSNASRCNWSLFKLCIIKKVENDALCWAYRTRPFAFKYHQRTHRYYPSTVKLDVKTSLGERELHVHLFCTVESHFLQGVYLSLTLCLCRFTNVSRAQKRALQSWSGIRYSLKSNMLALEAPRRLEAKQV